jgi:hypothetical protein
MSAARPHILYHGSPAKGIAEFEPRRETVRDPGEGPVVFASPDPAVAIIFGLRRTAHSGKFHGVPYAVIVADRDEYIADDDGCALYVLPSCTFENNPLMGLGCDEWISRVGVKPLESTEFTSSVSAAIEHGVQIYFVSAATSAAIAQSEDQGCAILHGLQSENQRQNRNARILEC